MTEISAETSRAFTAKFLLQIVLKKPLIIIK